MSDDQLTPEEVREVRELLKNRSLDSSVSMTVSETPPNSGRLIGRVGKYLVFVAKFFMGALSVLLVPSDIQDAFEYYRPVANESYEQVCKVVADIESGRKNPDEFPPTDKFILALPTTTTPPPPGEVLDIPVVASTGVPPEAIDGSGIVPPSDLYGLG